MAFSVDSHQWSRPTMQTTPEPARTDRDAAAIDLDVPGKPPARPPAGPRALATVAGVVLLAALAVVTRSIGDHRATADTGNAAAVLHAAAAAADRPAGTPRPVACPRRHRSRRSRAGDPSARRGGARTRSPAFPARPGLSGPRPDARAETGPRPSRSDRRPYGHRGVAGFRRRTCRTRRGPPDRCLPRLAPGADSGRARPASRHGDDHEGGPPDGGFVFRSAAQHRANAESRPGVICQDRVRVSSHPDMARTPWPMALSSGRKMARCG